MGWHPKPRTASSCIQQNHSTSHAVDHKASTLLLSSDNPMLLKSLSALAHPLLSLLSPLPSPASSVPAGAASSGLGLFVPLRSAAPWSLAGRRTAIQDSWQEQGDYQKRAPAEQQHARLLAEVAEGRPAVAVASTAFGRGLVATQALAPGALLLSGEASLSVEQTSWHVTAGIPAQ